MFPKPWYGENSVMIVCVPNDVNDDADDDYDDAAASNFLHSMVCP
jgi:hypothetical protein